MSFFLIFNLKWYLLSTNEIKIDLNSVGFYKVDKR